jgi:hypothetical protein
MTKKQREIMTAWELADEDFPDKSTEFIIAIVCDRCGCEYDDVIEALAMENEVK